MCVQCSNDAAQQVYTVLGHVCPMVKWCCTAREHCSGSCVSSDQMMLHSKCTLFWVMCVQWSNDAAQKKYTILGHVCPMIKWCCTASVHCSGTCVSNDQMMLHSMCTLFWDMRVQWSNDAAQHVYTVLGHVCVQWSQTAAKAVPGFVYKVISCSSLHVLFVLLIGHVCHMF